MNKIRPVFQGLARRNSIHTYTHTHIDRRHSKHHCFVILRAANVSIRQNLGIDFFTITILSHIRVHWAQKPRPIGILTSKSTNRNACSNCWLLTSKHFCIQQIHDAETGLNAFT
jgi:hypothetical protein